MKKIKRSAPVMDILGSRAIQFSLIAQAEQTSPGYYYVVGYFIEPTAQAEPLPFPIKIEPIADRAEAIMIAVNMLELGKHYCCPHRDVTYQVQVNRPGLLVVSAYVASKHNHHARLLYSMNLVFTDPESERWPLSALSVKPLDPADIEPDILDPDNKQD